MKLVIPYLGQIILLLSLLGLKFQVKLLTRGTEGLTASDMIF